MNEPLSEFRKSAQPRRLGDARLEPLLQELQDERRRVAPVAGEEDGQAKVNAPRGQRGSILDNRRRVDGGFEARSGKIPIVSLSRERFMGIAFKPSVASVRDLREPDAEPPHAPETVLRLLDARPLAQARPEDGERS